MKRYLNKHVLAFFFIMTFTFHPYDILCKIFGSKDVVRTRRDIYSAAEACVQNEVVQAIPSGSRGEGLELEGSDFDVMNKLKLIRVYESKDKRDTSDKAISVIMETDDAKIGFTRLRLMPLNENNSTLIRALYVELLDNWTVEHGCINYLSSALVREFMLNKNRTVHGPCQMIKCDVIEFEELFCVQCKEWIFCAHPWRYRPRGVWPTCEVINNITQYGVLFVPVGCKTSEYEHLEWRISFSIAEQQLIHSFTHVQFLCYAMLKTILSDVVKKLHGDLLCSYFVKTILFWISEEKDVDYWKENKIVRCYSSCLKRLIYCVEYRICLHYFIPEINFFEDRFTENKQKDLVKTLYDVYSRGWEGLLLTETFIVFMEEYNRNTLVTSSAVAPVMWIRMLNFIKDDNLEIYNRVLKYIVRYFNTPTVWMLTVYEYKLLTENNSIFQDGCNKYLYKQLKSVLPHVLLSTKFDCVTGWCYLASFFYQLKLYNKCQYIVKYCLRKCTTDKIWLNTGAYIKIPSDNQRLLVKNKYFSRIMQHHFIPAIYLTSASLLPAELNDTFNNELLRGRRVIIPPTVYLFFLDFLCNHHLQDNRAKKQSFRNLQKTVLVRHYIVNETLLINAENILGVALQIMDF